MSHAFVKEDDEQWLHDVAPTLTALVNYLSRENNGMRVYEKDSYPNAEGKTIHKMSNGFSYVVDRDGKWSIVD